MKGKSCNFKHEIAQEDCMLCMPNVMLLHINILLESICSMNVKFGDARKIYVAFDEIKDAQQGLVKLMIEAYPEAVERARIPKIESKAVV